MARIFADVEAGQGISDLEAEILVRWLWKYEGLSWLQMHSRWSYSPGLTLRDRVLNRLGEIRPHLSLAVSLIDHIDPHYGDAPVGIDSPHHSGAIFVSGVFCRIALMSLLTKAAYMVPKQFSIYHFNTRSKTHDEHAKLFFPQTGFLDDTEAVVVTKQCSRPIAALHDILA